MNRDRSERIQRCTDHFGVYTSLILTPRYPVKPKGHGKRLLRQSPQVSLAGQPRYPGFDPQPHTVYKKILDAGTAQKQCLLHESRTSSHNPFPTDLRPSPSRHHPTSLVPGVANQAFRQVPLDCDFGTKMPFVGRSRSSVLGEAVLYTSRC